LAEGVGFRIQVRLKAKTVFKTASISHSVTPRVLPSCLFLATTHTKSRSTFICGGRIVGTGKSDFSNQGNNSIKISREELHQRFESMIKSAKEQADALVKAGCIALAVT